jgi:hypothetical protein
MDVPPDATAAVLEPLLEANELVHGSARVVGCTLVLTDRRLFLVRDGAAHRPKTGVRTWPLDPRLTMRIGPNRHGSNRLVIECCGHAASAFLSSIHLAELQTLIDATLLRAKTA